jgi:hypothetical protein
VPLHRCGGVIHAHQKPSRHVLDAYALNVRQNQFTKAYPAKHVLSKVEGTLSAQRKTFCHFDRREKSFLDPSQTLGMTGLGPSLGVLCVFARVVLFRPK